MGKTKTEETPQQPNNSVPAPTEQEKRRLTYVVLRGGFRVNDIEYDTPDDPKALSWMEHYQRIINQWPDGTTVEIVQYDPKKHRAWG